MDFGDGAINEDGEDKAGDARYSLVLEKMTTMVMEMEAGNNGCWLVLQGRDGYWCCPAAMKLGSHA